MTLRTSRCLPDDIWFAPDHDELVPDRTATRPRVTRLLANAWDRRLTLVIAGSGYGKTTALHGLAPRCWLDRSAADRDVVRLAGRLRNGLGLAWEAVETTSTGPDDRATLADALAADLCSRLAETVAAVLVLDNVDQLGVGVPPKLGLAVPSYDDQAKAAVGRVRMLTS